MFDLWVITNENYEPVTKSRIICITLCCIEYISPKEGS